ncbi:MAG: M20 family metallo-hydrolase [Rhizobiaceae bacterium]|jgi:N-carbamoyl-L-amino-acid hydrolase|nr:M20 family metallo-hydrolase [Rhizobiaceae bacterium]
MAEPVVIKQTFKEDVLALMARYSEFGATPEGGVNRLAASSEDKDARNFLCQWLENHGFTKLIDPAGNIFGVLELDPSQPDTSLFCGSHLDSQPHGGRFDGTLGVVIACVAGLTLKDMIDRGEIENSYRNYVVACWTSEEGARFQPSLLGSRFFAGNLSKEDAWSLTDEEGISLKQALSDIGYLGTDTPPKPDHYLEVHIEQGKKLEDAGLSVGLVSSSWGARKLTLSITGKPDHTGPTPMAVRKDALLAASRVIVEVNGLAQRSKDDLHSSVGRLNVEPNSPNTVVSKAELWIEFRSADEAQLNAAEEWLQTMSTEISIQTGCEITQNSREVRAVVTFDRTANGKIRKTLDSAAIPNLSLTTIAGHDALQLQSICPSTLMFVRSKDGISHTPDEFTSDSDIETAFDASIAALSALVSQRLPM